MNNITEFAKEFKGKITSETMIIDGINYGDEFKRIAEFLKNLKPLGKAYLATPTRPPTEKWIRPPKEEVMNTAFQVFAEKLGVDRVEFLADYEGDAFVFAGDVEEDLLSITSVHPMRKEAVVEFLRKANADRLAIKKLLREGKLKELVYKGHKYYARRVQAEKYALGKDQRR